MKITNEELVMTNANQKKFDELEPTDKFYQLEMCANANTNVDTPFAKAWDKCSGIPKFKGIDAVRHGANPNLKGTKRWQRLEFTESDLNMYSLQESNEYHKFGKCFKGLRNKIGKGQAWKKCGKSFHIRDSVVAGEVIKDSIPKHNLYDLTEEANQAINHILSNVSALWIP